VRVDHCKRCNKLYNKIKTPYCPACQDEIDRQFGLIRNYMNEHPDADINTVLKNTGAEEKILLFLLREERLTISARPSIPCESCSKLIKSGRYCSECTVKLTTDFHKAGEAQKKVMLESSENTNNKSNDANKSTRGIHILKD